MPYGQWKDRGTLGKTVKDVGRKESEGKKQLKSRVTHSGENEYNVININ